MDLLKIIHDLREERKKLDLIIASLEQLEDTPAPRITSPTGRRGRRFMDAEGRLEVSRRMKKYWENRRNQEQGEEMPRNSRTVSGSTYSARPSF